MSLIDALKDAPEPKTRVAAILLKVSAAERAVLEAALSNPDWPHDTLARVLTDSGHPISEASVRRYRRGLK